MENITYSIGAGASYHSLPLVKNMNSRMQAFSTFLKVQMESGIKIHPYANKFIEDLEKLISIESERTSIDAHAKELYLSSPSHANIELVRLKLLLSSYLVFEQFIKPTELTLYSNEYAGDAVPASRMRLDLNLANSIKTSLDKRYITFWADYLTPSSDVLPPNINIISWNYDMQFEASYSSIKKYNLEFTQQNLQVFPSPHQKIDLSKSCILKLNGTAEINIGCL